MRALYKIPFLIYLFFVRLQRWKRVIVLERVSGLGDVICCIPAYRALKEKYPKHLVIFATAQPLADLLKYCHEIDAVYGIPRGLDIPKERAAWLVDRHYEPHTSDEQKQGGKKLHLARVFLKDCGLPVENWQPRISIPTGIREAVARRFGFRPGEPIIALHSGRTWPVRELPAESWREIVRRIKQRFQGRLIHFCAPTRVDQLDLPVQCFEDVQAMPENLELVAVAAVLSQCRLLIGIDSGLLHLAGTVGTPTLGVFGAVNPEFRLPVGTPSKGVYAALPCSFCHHETPIKHWLTGCPYDIRCMKEISVDQVMKAVESILDVK